MQKVPVCVCAEEKIVTVVTDIRLPFHLNDKVLLVLAVLLTLNH